MADYAAKTDQKVPKCRHNIVLAGDARERGDRLAKEDLRSFSNLMEWLIEQEWNRRHPNDPEGRQMALPINQKAA